MHGRKGGGAAVVASNSSFVCKQFKTNVPDGIEMSWIQATAKWDPSTKYLVGAFYSSSSAEFKPVKNALQLHILDVIDSFLGKFPNGQVIVAGDINQDSLEDIISLPGFRSHVDKPTRGDNFLDVIVSNMDQINNDVFPPSCS